MQNCLYQRQAKSPKTSDELLTTLKTRPTATKVDWPSKTSIESSSKNP